MAQDTRVIAIRGATTVERDEPGLIRSATGELLGAILERNGLTTADLISVVFTATPDLTSDFPAHGARLLGWTDVPLLCAAEIAVEGALPRCIRVLIHAQTPLAKDAVQHVYLRDAVTLRPDLAAT